MLITHTKYEEGNLIIKPGEAEEVKRIYQEYSEGASLLKNGRGLEAGGILTGVGKTKWRPETLKKILQNEKYIGDVLLQKTYTVDFLNKKRVQNKGIVLQYYVENSHEPIILRDLYMQVQEEMIRRANLHSGDNRKRGFTAASMPYPALFTAPSAAKFTGRLYGITVENILPCGGAVPVWNMDQPPVTHQLFRSKIYRRRWYRRSTLRLATEKT